MRNSQVVFEPKKTLQYTNSCARESDRIVLQSWVPLLLANRWFVAILSSLVL